MNILEDRVICQSDGSELHRYVADGLFTGQPGQGQYVSTIAAFSTIEGDKAIVIDKVFASFDLIDRNATAEIFAINVELNVYDGNQPVLGDSQSPKFHQTTSIQMNSPNDHNSSGNFMKEGIYAWSYMGQLLQVCLRVSPGLTSLEGEKLGVPVTVQFRKRLVNIK